MNVGALVLETNAVPIMEVLDQERPVWTLLVEGLTYYLDVRCPVGKSCIYLLVKLNAEEMQMFLTVGRSYLDHMAAQIQSYPQWYYSRNQPIEVQKRVADTLSRLSERKPK